MKREFDASKEFKSDYYKHEQGKGFLNSIAKMLNLSRPLSAQDTIPIRAMYQDGLFELPNSEYSKSWRITDINFNMESDEKKEAIYEAYQAIFKRFPESVRVQISLTNRYRNLDEYNADILMTLKNDGNDVYREEINEMLKEKELLGENRIEKGIFVTLTLTAESAEEARELFKPIERDMSMIIHGINKSRPAPMTINERCALLYDIMNSGREGDFLQSYIKPGETAFTYDMSKLREMGLTPKDVITPSAFAFDRKAFRIGDKFGQVICFKKDYPAVLMSDILVKINAIPATMSTSVHCTTLPRDITTKALHRAEATLNSNIASAQKKAIRDNYSPELAAQRFVEQKEDLDELRRDVAKGDQQLVNTVVVIMHTADTMDVLEKQRRMIEATCKGHSLNVADLSYEQEEGLMSAMPIGFLDIEAKRTLTTQVCACMLPFESQEIYHKNGLYYGTNAITQRMLIYDRKRQKAANAIVLGTPGSGKSFKTKEELVQVFLNTNDFIYIIDPENEYSDLVRNLGGSAIMFSAGGDTRINPFDITDDYASDGEGSDVNPLVLKNAIITSLFETMMGGQLGGTYTSIIDRCLSIIYRKWLVTKKKEDIPTFQDMFNALNDQPEGEAAHLARQIEKYAIGSMNLFAGQTNVDLKNRIVSYNTKNLETNASLRDMALIACLNDIWNKITENHKKGIYTWVYIDEFHLFLRSRAVREFLLSIWKRARKFYGCPTGITQNASDLLNSQEAATILSNSDTVIMLNQAENDRRLLTMQYGLSEAEANYLRNAPIGTGLMKVGDLVNGEVVIPFTDAFPRGRLFNLMNTSSEIQLNAQQYMYGRN